MANIEEYIQPTFVLVLGCITIICYSFFGMNPILTCGITITTISIIEILTGRAIGTKEFKGLFSTIKIVKRKEQPSEFYFYILIHSITGLFLAVVTTLNYKNLI